MSATIEKVFEDAKSMMDFTDKDAKRLREMGPIFAKHGPQITESFYAKLHTLPEASSIIQGREEALKSTHQSWMEGLFGGDYGSSYLENRMRIGLAHVRVNIPQYWVEYVMSILRVKCLEALQSEGGELVERYSSLVKILDLDLLIINIAYAEERLDRLTNFTGMSRKLLERCIEKGT